MEFYKCTDVQRALQIMHPGKTILSLMTMHRYLKAIDPVIIPEEWKKFEKSKNVDTWFVSRDGLIVMVEQFNKGERHTVDLEILLKLVEKIAAGETIELDKIYKDEERIKELEELLEKKEEKIAKLVNQLTEYESQNTKLLTDGGLKDHKIKELEEHNRAVEEKNNRFHQYLLDVNKYESELEEYNTMNKIARWLLKKQKPIRPKFEE